VTNPPAVIVIPPAPVAPIVMNAPPIFTIVVED
jgi:hypothetical protein